MSLNNLVTKTNAWDRYIKDKQVVGIDYKSNKRWWGITLRKYNKWGRIIVIMTWTIITIITIIHHEIAQRNVFINMWNRRINSRKSISSMSVIAATEQLAGGYNNSLLINNNMKSVNGNKSSNRVFFGVGGGNFYQTQKLDTLRCPTVVDNNRSTTNKMHTCESSINMHTVSNNTKTNTL